jgi:hypothetical protein
MASAMSGMKQLGLIAAMAMLLATAAGAAPGPWDQPAAALAGKIADILGPGQARLTVRNLSTIPDGALPIIRRLLEQDLKDRGILESGAESANGVRVTLSESATSRLWVAEVTEGDQTQVAMVTLPLDHPQQASAGGGLLLRSEPVIAAPEPVLAALEVANNLVALEPDEIVIYARAGSGWQQQSRVSIAQNAPLPRDPRGVLAPSATGNGFEAWLPDTHCTGSLSASDAGSAWMVACNASDDPWTLASVEQAQPGAGTVNSAASAPFIFKAFYNAARNYFTGVISPGVGVDLPAFYSAALIPRAAGAGALLIDGIDGKVQLAENGTLTAVDGARDWGSDLGVLRSGCGTGTQIVASGSGEAVSDSLRAYELPALEAIPVSTPLAMDGTVTAVWSAPDGKSVYAAVRTAANQFEVERVTALCN